MKQTLLTRLVLGAIAGLSVSAAHAGQIQASSVSIAREAITADTQAVTSPSIAYRFAGDVDARVQAQTFQVQFTLAAGEFNTLPATIARAISVSDGVTGQIQDQSAGAPVVVNASYTVVAADLSADKKTLWATITVNQGATALIKQPLIALNVTSNTIAGVTAVNTTGDRSSVIKLYSVAGDLAADFAATATCQAVKTLAVSFKHFVALTAPATMATETTATADEHTRAGATNLATLMTFPTNILPVVTASQGDAKVDPAQANNKFAGTIDAGDFTSFVSTTLVNLGAVTLKQNSTGYDSNLLNQYLLAPNLSAVAAAAVDTGLVETTSIDIKVAATGGFAVGSTLFLAPNNDCSTGALAATTITAANAAGPITLSIPQASLVAFLPAGGTTPEFVSNNAAATYANVCMSAPPVGTPIPSSAFTATVTVKKAPGAVGVVEQNNTCSGNLYSLGGGIKIDVRNYASSKETSGYQSVIRLINNSEARAADVYGQIIHQDGTYGPYGLLTTLAPRAILNMTAAQIDAKLVNAPAHATAALNGSNAPAAATSGAPRLRITSNTGDTLRVQNYMFNSATGQILEASGGQGVDFEGTNARAPANDGQYISQDAPLGLNGR